MAEVLWTSGEIAAATGGRLAGAPFEAAGIGIDSRSLAGGDLFVALPACGEWVPRLYCKGLGLSIKQGEAFELSGEVDFILKCVAPDMAKCQDFVTHLPAAPHVRNVRTSLVLHNSKYEAAVPLEVKARG